MLCFFFKYKKKSKTRGLMRISRIRRLFYFILFYFILLNHFLNNSCKLINFEISKSSRKFQNTRHQPSNQNPFYWHQPFKCGQCCPHQGMFPVRHNVHGPRKAQITQNYLSVSPCRTAPQGFPHACHVADDEAGIDAQDLNVGHGALRMQ